MNEAKKIASADFNQAVQIEHSHGLDISNPDYILFQRGNIRIEVIGGIQDVMLSSLRVALKVYKQGTVSPMDIYRTSQVDLFHENQTDYLILKICERLKLESTQTKNILYDFIERLDNYRRNKERILTTVRAVPSSNSKQALAILKSENLLDEIKELLTKAGVSDIRLGLQIYIASLSRITQNPIHSILLGPKLLSNSLISEIVQILPEEDTRELTTISKHALSYPPTMDFWDNKTLVLHKIESVSKTDNTLLEYLLNGESKRLVTGSNKQGIYQSHHRNITSTINLISYTDKDFHPVFNSKGCICIPITNTESIKEKLYEKEIKSLSGGWDTDSQESARQILKQLAREIKNLSIYNPVIEYIDLAPFFGKNLKALHRFLQLTNMMALLHQYKQDIKITKTKKIVEVKPAYMKEALLLYKELWLKKDDELYFNVRNTFTSIKNYLKKKYKAEASTSHFTLKQLRRSTNLHRATLQRHLDILEDYDRIERIGGNKKEGFQYQILQWEETQGQAQAFEDLLQALAEA